MPAEIKGKEMSHKDSSDHPFSCVTCQTDVPWWSQGCESSQGAREARQVQAGRHKALGAEGHHTKPLHTETQIHKWRD